MLNANTGGPGGYSVYCAILIAKYNAGGGAIKEGLNAKNRVNPSHQDLMKHETQNSTCCRDTVPNKRIH